jgi:hypothetical protein
MDSLAKLIRLISNTYGKVVDFWRDLWDIGYMENQFTSQMIQKFFTEDEWDAIYNAMADYQDHGESETELSYSVQEKITELFDMDDSETVPDESTGWN